MRTKARCTPGRLTPGRRAGLLPHVRRLLPALSPQGVPLAEKDTDCTWGACPLDCACDEVVL